jgi:hypothetical protein
VSAQLELAGPGPAGRRRARLEVVLELALRRAARAASALGTRSAGRPRAWQRVTGARPRPHELEWLRALDLAFLKAHAPKPKGATMPVPRIEVRTTCATCCSPTTTSATSYATRRRAGAEPTATTVRAEAARRIGKTYNMKITAVKGQMEIRRAMRGTTCAPSSGERPADPADRVRCAPGGSGVSVKVKGRKVVTHAFIATMKSGHRASSCASAKGRPRRRLPIKQLFSLSLPVAFSQKQILDALFKVIRERFAEVMAQEVRYLQLKNNTLRMR